MGPIMIVYCCHDLLFATKIRSTAEAIGIPNRPARDREALQKRLDCIDDGKTNEPVTAVLIDLEMGVAGLDLLAQSKAHDRQLPVIAFGSHVATDVLQAAHDRGADVVPRQTAERMVVLRSATLSPENADVIEGATTSVAGAARPRRTTDANAGGEGFSRFRTEPTRIEIAETSGVHDLYFVFKNETARDIDPLMTLSSITLRHK